MPIFAMNSRPSKLLKFGSRRLACASALMSFGLTPNALSAIARKLDLVMFHAFEVPLSSSWPPETVIDCQNLRLVCGPESTVNSNSSITASLDFDALKRPASTASMLGSVWSPGRIDARTGANTPSGMRPSGLCSCASLRSSSMSISFRLLQGLGRSTRPIDLFNESSEMRRLDQVELAAAIARRETPRVWRSATERAMRALAEIVGPGISGGVEVEVRHCDNLVDDVRELGTGLGALGL